MVCSGHFATLVLVLFVAGFLLANRTTEWNATGLSLFFFWGCAVAVDRKEQAMIDVTVSQACEDVHDVVPLKSSKSGEWSGDC